MAPEQELFATKSDFAYRAVRHRILGGEVEPGQVLNQAALAKDLGISTTPLREALRRLRSEGLVELESHRDARVTPLSAGEAQDLLEVRRSLDPLAVSLAAQRRTEADVTAMRAALAEVSSLGQHPTYEELIAHRRLHRALYSASHNEVLTTTLDGLWDTADRYRRAGARSAADEGYRHRKAREHAELVDLVARGEAEQAAALMLQHIDTSLGAQAAAALAQPSQPAS
ncbi:GntR family transcriptional regulator [Kineococcus sp. SYSU DK002]|uniref:GntR family transcriptional regulator n=1 Tax=Kineococcus sp. SYSU DK002 TaxID=3383123 RepID=UPI003D7EB2B7